MKVPFTIEQFLQVFKDYNLSIWPGQIIFYLLGIIILFFTIKKTSYSNLVINIILSFLWLWMGIIYHLIFFTAINKGAYLFGFIYIIHSMLTLYYGAFKSTLTYHFTYSFYSFTGGLLICYALIFYPIIGFFVGHSYPAAPTFGLPCPTTIFTLGLYLLTETKMPKFMLIIPTLWSFIGYSAAFQFGILEDIGLLISGIIVTSLILFRDRKGLLFKSTNA
ncbi:DUF6064 family protein [Flavihumibacter fluvii]|uniref:DUF6064 family protein n=1 Tax=Flavihumibacter fluvii TaxID=2838157 RepID=UPI001BDF7217|nr:DUF6064 family protein [Flavihumibacter fluvii]ULQ54311.1 DUF6064 family protein [Flavihumibacter fluvii]